MPGQPTIVIVPENKPYAPLWLERLHGIRCRDIDGTLYADREDAQTLIDAYDPLPDATAGLKEVLALVRKARSDAIADDREKFLSLGEFVDLLFVKDQLGGLTIEQSRLQTALLGAWAAIGDVQTAAARVEADIDALSDAGTAETFDVAEAFDAHLAELRTPPAPTLTGPFPRPAGAD